jgi:hypothetical protein
MANLTKKFMESYVADLNSKTNVGIKIVADGSEYTVVSGRNILFTGTTREAYILLQGMSYGLRAKVEPKVIQNSDNLSGYDYLSDKFRDKKALLIEAKKTAADSYYSQHKLKYTINIGKLTSTSLTFVGEVKKYTNDDTPIYGSLLIPATTIKIDSSLSIDDIAKRILKGIDYKIQQMAKKSKDIHYDYMLWIDKDVMWYLGWSNDAMITKKVDIKVI